MTLDKLLEEATTVPCFELDRVLFGIVNRLLNEKGYRLNLRGEAPEGLHLQVRIEKNA